MSAAGGTQSAPLEPPPPTLLVWAGFIAMMFGNFMAQLDIQIVASSIGAIQAGTSASRDEISWVQTSYLIAEVIGIPLSGFLARAFGTRLLFCVSALTFSLTSLLCAFAWDLPSLIAFRALQGFCGAPMVPLTVATTYVVFPRNLQMVAGALTGLVMTSATTFGPTVGGWIASAMGWRALFWLNIFPGPLVAVMVWSLMRQLDGPKFDLLKRIDVIGLIGMAVFLGAAEYTLEEGPANGWFASTEVRTWAIITLIGAAIFFWRAFTAETPIVDLRPFRSTPYAVGSCLIFVVGIGLFGSVFLTPLFLSSVRNYNSLQIGHTMIVQGLTMFILGPTVGIWGRHVTDTRALAVGGLGLVAASCWVQAHMTTQAAFWELALPQALRGAGLMLTFTSLMMPAIQSLPPHLIHAGTSMFSTVRNIGGAFGIAALTTIQTHGFALHRQELYAAADASNPHVAGMIEGARAHLEQTGAEFPERQALMHYAGMLDREALVMAFNDQFLILGLVTAISALAVVFLRAKPYVASAPAERAMPSKLSVAATE